MATNTPICVKTECSNEAAFNKFFPDSDGGQYWTMCDKCYNEEHGEDDEEVCWTCGDKATNKEWRESLDEFEWTCDKCHNEEYKSCSHKFECGCGKQSCLEMGLDNCDEDFCDNESCRHYYDHRNDNCDCGRCGYCDSDLDQ